jgi:hypothetical protein
MSSPSGGAWLSQSDTTRLPSFLTVATFWRIGATRSASRDGPGECGFFFYCMYADLQTLKAQVAFLSNTSTSTAPLVQIGSAIATNDLQALCLITGHPTICQRVGMNPQRSVPATPVPSPQKEKEAPVRGRETRAMGRMNDMRRI